MTMTAERLAEIAGRCSAATTGPWSASPAGWVDRPPYASINRMAFVEVADAEFVAHSRADVPDLVAEVKRLTAAVIQPWAAGGFVCIVCHGYGESRGVMFHKEHCAFMYAYCSATTSTGAD
jgi:hypothetical protein